MTELSKFEFEAILERQTGKILGKDYGYVIGTHSPFKHEGFNSSINVAGFNVWKKEMKGGDSIFTKINIAPGTQMEYINKIIEFLNS